MPIILIVYLHNGHLSILLSLNMLLISVTPIQEIGNPVTLNILSWNMSFTVKKTNLFLN